MIIIKMYIRQIVNILALCKTIFGEVYGNVKIEKHYGDDRYDAII